MSNAVLVEEAAMEELDFERQLFAAPQRMFRQKADGPVMVVIEVFQSVGQFLVRRLERLCREARGAKSRTDRRTEVRSACRAGTSAPAAGLRLQKARPRRVAVAGNSRDHSGSKRRRKRAGSVGVPLVRHHGRSTPGSNVIHPTRSRAFIRQTAVCVAIVSAVWIVAIAHWSGKNAVVPWDSKNQFYAFFRFLSATIRSGDWPLWNPYHYGGHPSVADPQSLCFLPCSLPGVARSGPDDADVRPRCLCPLLAGGIGIAVIGWRARWSIPGSVLAAALFMFGGAASGRLQHSGIILSYGLFPLALLLLQLSFERRSLLLAAAVSVVAANIALGRNQVALLLCGLLLAAATAEVSGARQPIAYLRERKWVLTTMAATCGALLIVPLLLTMQFAQLSNRPAELMEGALKGSLYPADLANLAVADVFGTHHSYWGPGAATLTGGRAHG